MLHGIVDADRSTPDAKCTNLTLGVFTPQNPNSDKVIKLKNLAMSDYDITDISTKISKIGQLTSVDDAMSTMANISHVLLQLVKGRLSENCKALILVVCMYMMYAKLDSAAVKHKDKHPFLHCYIFNKMDNIWKLSVEHGTNSQFQQLVQAKRLDEVPKRKLISILTCALGFRADIIFVPVLQQGSIPGIKSWTPS